MALDPRILTALLLCLVLLGLGGFVWLRNRHGAANRRFGLSMIAIAGWIGSISISFSVTDPSLTLFLARLAFAFASVIPFALLLLFESFRSHAQSRHAVLLAFAAILAVLFAALSLSPWIVTGVAPNPGRPNLLYGPLHKVFAVYFLSLFLFAIFRLYRRSRTASGLQRLQLRYLLLGVLIGGAGAITTNLLIPLIWRTSAYSTLGPYFSLVVAGFAAHAIIRYRLMDIRVVVRKGVVYFSSIVLVSLIFFLGAVLARLLVGYEEGLLPLPLALAMSIATAILFQPLKAYLQSSLNRYLYREPYDYHRIVREASHRLSTTLDLESLLSYLVRVIQRTLRVDFVCVYLRDELTKSFVPQLVHQPEGPEQRSLPSLPLGAAVTLALEKGTRLLVRQERIAHDPSGTFAAATVELERLGAEVAFAFGQDQAFSGFLLVGQKLSGDAFFVDDFDLLSTLAGQADVAIKNAQLYRQVVRANDYVENILSTIESGVIAAAPDETVSIFNPAAERITGLRATEMKGRHIKNLPPALAIPLTATLSDGQARAELEGLIQDSGGRLTPVICSTSALRDPTGVSLGAVAAFSDLTRLHQLEAEKRRVERLASIGALASGIAHEIKNPLVAIKTFAELLPERFSDEEFRSDFARVVVQEIDRIDELIGRLRGMATPQARRELVDIRPTIDETLALLRGQLEQARVTVILDYAPQLPMVRADRAQLKQLFLNLFINAIEAMRSGGTLTVRLYSRFAGRQYLTVEVSDSGAGIPDVLLEKVFDPFMTTKPDGSGLGLSICRGIAEAHGATIRAVNQSCREGATIVVDFPVPDSIGD